MKKTMKFLSIFLFVFVNYISMYPEADVQINEPEGLYGQSALLMDADSGRVLFEKDGYRKMPMASTTKIMTCLVALERCSQDETVHVSAEAASQPPVRMNITKGEAYRLGDLLRGMMLESYNDVAAAVAEHVGGSLEGFAALMNEKALALGCTDTHFITPNGLDAADEAGEHSTTARDLALILSAAIANPDFLEITQTMEHTISEMNGARTAGARNKNALLQNMEGAISGKTGFTGKAGFCYAGAVRRDERTLVAVSLACGWPPHKTYKWQDMQKLFQYGFDSFHYQTVDTGTLEVSGALTVEKGRSPGIGRKAKVQLVVPKESFRLLIRDDESLTVSATVKDRAMAPVEKGESLGEIRFLLNGETVRTEPITAAMSVPREDFSWNLSQVGHSFLP